MSNETQGSIQTANPRKRNLGLDLFRLIGVFIVMIGHYAMFIDYSPLTGLGDYFKHPLFWNAIDYAIVPVFLMISGYFSLTKPLSPEEDTKKTFKSFWRIFRIYVFWTVVGILITFIIGGLTNTHSANVNYLVDFFHILVTPAMVDGFFVNAQLWYLWIFMGLILITPIFRGFFSNVSVKLIRKVMLFAFLGMVLVPSLIMLSRTMLVDVVWFNQIFASTTFFDINRYGNAMLFLFLLGAWFRKDPAAQRMVEKTPFWGFAILIVLGCVVMVAHNAISIMLWLQAPAANFTVTNTVYDSLLIVPVGLMLFAFFRKLDDRITEESKLGSFVQKHAGKSLIIYVVHMPVMEILLRTLDNAGTGWLGTTHSNVLDNLLTHSNMFVELLNHTIFGVVMFCIMFVIAELLQRIPFMKKFL